MDYKNTISFPKKTLQKIPKNINKYLTTNSSNTSQTYFQITQIDIYMLDK